MAEEIIKVLEYITGNELTRGVIIAYFAAFLLVFAAAITIVIVMIRKVFSTHDSAFAQPSYHRFHSGGTQKKKGR